jgi:hypothetical protein
MSKRVPRVTPKNLSKVLKNLTEFLDTDERAAKNFCMDFNELLNYLLSMDFFGTEGQSDPRGDHRG